MKSFEVKYTKGHLVDTKTNKRIFLKRGGVFNILGDDNQFEEKDELHFETKPLSETEKLLQLEKNHKDFSLIKIASKDQNFVYRIGLSKSTKEDKEKEFLFNCTILEDLYIRSRNGEDWSLCDCICVTTECLEGDVQMIESVNGNSLNNLFSNMIAFYFPMQRSGACNAFDYFYFINNEDKPRLFDVKYYSKFRKLNDRRKEIVVELKRKINNPNT
jgi:hypothetical protein